jgi:uncharacterized protein YqjF (DUF2071 family)
MGQTWRDLLFMHWPVEPDALREVMHPSMPLDTWEGRAWIGVTPFAVSGLHPRFGPPVPAAARFPEVNVRTYVTVEGRPGIWFFSLDAASAAAVAVARRVYRLPYFRAVMTMEREANGDGVTFVSERATGPAAALEVSYRPAGRTTPGGADELEHWLTERYCLYTVDAAGRPLRGEIHHPPWPLQPAEARIARNTMTAPLGIELTGEPLLHYAARQDVLVWPPRPVA